MKLEDMKKFVDAKKAEIREIDKEHAATIKSFGTRRATLESQIIAFENEINRRTS